MNISDNLFTSCALTEHKKQVIFECGRRETMKELERVRNRLLGLATSTRSLQRIINAAVDDISCVDGVNWVEVKVERPSAKFTITYSAGKRSKGETLVLPLRNGGTMLGRFETEITRKRRGMVSLLRDITRILAITLENRMLRGEKEGWLLQEIATEVGRIDRYGGEFSVCLLRGVGGKRGAGAVMKDLNDNIRQVDKVGEWRGKVAVLMPSTDETGAVSAARRLTEMLFPKRKKIWAGVATYPKDATFAAGLLEAAEIAADWAQRTKKAVFTYGALVQCPP